MPDRGRVHVGIWSELGAGARWANEGVSRVIGFVIEGAAKSGRYLFHVIVQPGFADTVRADLRTLDAMEGRDWLVSEPDTGLLSDYLNKPEIRTLKARERRIAAAALYCNDHIDVAGWFISFPFFTGATYLTKPKATLMPDSLGHDFPTGWSPQDWAEDGSNELWRINSTKVTKASDHVITFSKHVARRHAAPLLDTPMDKIQVVPLAPPDLKGLLPFLNTRRRSEESHSTASDLLRRYARTAGVTYLEDFPFEEVPYAFTATQDRISKNLGRAAEAVRRLVVERRDDFKLILTASFLFGADWTLLPQLMETHQINRDIISVTDVPREIHAALFHCATVTIHPTFFEGIVGALPFYESLSVGTPCLMARGPHINELLEAEPDLAPFVFDPYDVEGLANLMVEVKRNREAAVDIQLPIYERLSQYGWDQVAESYARHSITRSGLAA